MAWEPKGRVVKWAKGTIWLDDGILFTDNPPGVHVTVEDAREITRIFQGLAPDGAPLCVNLDNGSSQDRAVRDYFANDPIHLQTYSACALLVGGAASKILANFFMGLNKPKRPTRLFTSHDRALEWLEGYRRGPRP